MRRCTLLALVPLFAIVAANLADEPKEKPKAAEQTGKLELAGFKTVETAMTAKIQPRGAKAGAGQTGYLGVYVQPDAKGKLAVEQVGTESPAAKAGLQVGDLIVKIDNQLVADIDHFRGRLQAKSPGDQVALVVSRKGKQVETIATLTATSKPMKLSGERVGLGIRLADGEDGVKVDGLSPDSPAAKAGVKVGDLVLRIDGAPLANRLALNDLLADRRAGDPATLSL